MATSVETILIDNNTIIKLNNKYSSGTVIGYYYDNSNKINITITELGEDYIEIPALTAGIKLYIEYNILGTLPTDNQTEYDLIARIVRLEKSMEDLLVIVQAQKEALNNRVNNTSFKAWTRLIEKKMGIKLVDGDLNYLSKELYK